MLYGFILSVWKSGNADLKYIENAVKAGLITEIQKNDIINNPKY